MFVPRKLFLLVAMALTALAMTSSASAQVEVHDEPGTLCSNVSLSDHAVSGGCHVEFKSTDDISAVVYIPGPLPVFSCRWHFEAQIGGDGAGYITTAALTPPSGGGPCTRVQCAEADGTRIPWPVQINEAAGSESFEMRFCIEQSNGSGFSCTVHLSVEDEGGHNYEFGAEDGEAFCEPGDSPYPVGFRNAHFVNEVPAETGAEDVEIVH